MGVLQSSSEPTVEIPINIFLNRVVKSEHRVEFTHIDSYNHLNAGRYVEFLINHRFTAPETCFGFKAMELSREKSVGFYISSLNINYKRPALLGHTIEIGSWFNEFSPSQFKVKFIFADKEKRRKLADGNLMVAVVDVKTGYPTQVPDSFPSVFDEAHILSLETSEEFQSSVK